MYIHAKSAFYITKFQIKQVVPIYLYIFIIKQDFVLGVKQSVSYLPRLQQFFLLKTTRKKKHKHNSKS